MQVQFCHIFQIPKSVNLDFNIKFPDCLNFGKQQQQQKNHENKLSKKQCWLALRMFVLGLKQINRMRTKSTNLVITDDKRQEKSVALHIYTHLSFLNIKLNTFM